MKKQYICGNILVLLMLFTRKCTIYGTFNEVYGTYGALEALVLLCS